MDKSQNKAGVETLFEQPLDVLTIGLDGFTQDLLAQQVPVNQLDWAPPAEGDPELADLLSKLGC